MPIIKTTFSEVSVGSYFTLRKGLLWCKVSQTKAKDVWSGRIVTISPEVVCSVRIGMCYK